MSRDETAQVKAATMMYQRKGDFEGAVTLLEETGWDRSAAVTVLRQSDLVAARVTLLLAIALLALGGVAWTFWPDANWLLLVPLAWGVERAFRAATLIRRAKSL